MAPEALELQQYSSKSDIFSFGVVVYEILSERSSTICCSDMKRDPWPGISSTQAAVKISKGERMEIPENSPEVLKSLVAKYNYALYYH